MASSDNDGWEDVAVAGSDHGWEDVPPSSSNAAGTLQKVGQAAVRGAGHLSEALDITGPLRAGISEFQKSGSPVNAFMAAKLASDQTGAPQPSWKDIMAATGLSKEESIPVPGLITQPFEKGEKQYAHVSPAGVAGAVMGTVTDPLSYVGLPAEGVAEAIPRTATRAAEGLENLAAQRAVKQTTGESRAALREAAGVTTKGAGQGIEAAEGNIKDFGRTLLEKDEAGPAALHPSAKQTAINAGKKKDFFGDKIGEIGEQIDKAMPVVPAQPGVTSTATGGAIDGNSIAQAIKSYAESIPPASQGIGLRERLLKEADAISGIGPMSFKDAQKLKNQYNFKPQDADALVSSQDATNKVRSLISDEMENAVDRVAAAKPDGIDPETLSKYQYYKDKYGAYKAAEAAATQSAIAQLSRRFVEPSTYATGLASGLAALATTHNPVLTGAAILGGAAANKVGKMYGSYAAAKGADAIASVIRNSPETFNKWLPALTNAAGKGPAALSLAHHLLMSNDPDYYNSFTKQAGGQP